MAKKRGKNKDNARRSKKKVSILDQEKIEYVDWKDVDLLRRFMSDRAKIRARRVTGNDAQQQREVAQAIKNARVMALLPYTHRVTQQRGGRSKSGDSSSASGPPPVPKAPPPTRGSGEEAPPEGTEEPTPAPSETTVAASDAADTGGDDT